MLLLLLLLLLLLSPPLFSFASVVDAVSKTIAWLDLHAVLLFDALIIEEDAAVAVTR